MARRRAPRAPRPKGPLNANGLGLFLVATTVNWSRSNLPTDVRRSQPPPPLRIASMARTHRIPMKPGLGGLADALVVCHPIPSGGHDLIEVTIPCLPAELL